MSGLIAVVLIAVLIGAVFLAGQGAAYHRRIKDVAPIIVHVEADADAIGDRLTAEFAAGWKACRRAYNRPRPNQRAGIR